MIHPSARSGEEMMKKWWSRNVDLNCGIGMFGFGIKNVQFFEFFEKLNFLDTEIERG